MEQVTLLGSSCCTGTTKPRASDKIAEVRHVLERNDFEANVDFCLANNIYIIANIDNWRSTGDGKVRYNGKEQEWRQRVDAIAFILLQKNPRADKFEITIDNEPMKKLTREDYAWLVNIAWDQIKVKRGWRHIQIGAGNEEFSLAEARGNMLEYICQNCQFDILHTHWQAAITTKDYKLNPAALDRWANFAVYLRDKYKKKLGCSEANWFDLAKEQGYNDLIKVLNKVESIGIKQFPIVFIQRERNDKHPYTWLCFIYDHKIRSNYWYDWLKLTEAKAPKQEEQTMRLEKFYYQGKVTFTRDPKRAGVRFIQACLGAKPDGIFGPKTDTAVREYQTEKEIAIDGIVGPVTFREFMSEFPGAYVDLQYFTAIGDW